MSEENCKLIIIKTLLIITAVILLVIAAVILLTCAVAVGYAFVLLKKWPPLSLYSARRKQPDFLPADQLPPRFLQLLIRQEDTRFYTHHGIDPDDIRSALRRNWAARKIVRGGSGITQQLAKNLYFRRFTRSWLRKLAELVIALNLERSLGKKRILELYVNIIYFGNGIYGIADAARFYFNKPASDLTLNQMVILSLMPPLPTAGNPVQHPDVLKRFRDRKLERFGEEPPLISPEEAEEIRSHDADNLDPELRKPDDYTRNYPTVIPLSNERYGPLSREH
jgi:penicillin-binding protein 2A